MKLKKSLYGLKQSPRVWNSKINDFLLKNNYIKSAYDPCIYFVPGSEKHNINNLEVAKIIIALYVDDLVISSKNLNEIKNFEKRKGSKKT